jgi:uncharacterized protein (DUF433 family)
LAVPGKIAISTDNREFEFESLAYPLLEPEDITAALEYAARHSDHPVLRST